MANIIADTPDIEGVIKRLADTVTQNGGWFNPRLEMIAKDGQLSIEADGIQHGEPLIKITKDMLIPMQKINLSLKDDLFHIEIPKPDAWEPVERAVTDITFKMFNLMDKARFHKENNFWMCMQPYADTVDLLMEGRTQNDKIKKMLRVTRGETEIDWDQFVCDDFVKSRVLGFKNEKTGLSISVIMTVIDFLNHHAGGAYFQAHKNGVNVACSQPVQGSRQCFAFYRPVDAFDSLVHYGFVDSSASYVRSIPLKIDVPDIGRIVIKSRGDVLNKQKLSKPVQDLQFFIPAMNKTYDIVTASHLYIPGPRAPHALRRVLGLLIGRLLTKPLPQDEMVKLIEATEDQIISKNKVFFQNMLSHLSTKEKEMAESDMMRQVHTMIKAQLQIIEDYQPFDQFKKSRDQSTSSISATNG